MVKTPHPPSKRTATARNVNALLFKEALTTWLPPTVVALFLGAAVLLDALGAVSEQVAALTAVITLLILGVFAVVGPLLRDPHPAKLGPAMLGGVALVWIALFSTPFAMRLFPGAPVATTALEKHQASELLPIGEGHFDMVLDAHLPMTSERQNRELHYALTVVDGTGQSHRYDGELGDRWQTRRLGRRGTVPVHLQHLSTAHEIDSPAGGTLRLDDVTLSGVPNATLAASFYRHRIPGTMWLLCGGALLALGALAFDLRWDLHRTPATALLTATATGAVLVFCSSAAGHPGLRQVFGSAIVGGIGGVPTVGLAAWLARHSSWTRAITSRRAT